MHGLGGKSRCNHIYPEAAWNSLVAINAGKYRSLCFWYSQTFNNKVEIGQVEVYWSPSPPCRNINDGRRSSLFFDEQSIAFDFCGHMVHGKQMKGMRN